jgi:hypothetical protein
MRNNTFNDYSSLKPDINKYPAKKFMPWVYPTFGKYIANFFNKFSNRYKFVLSLKYYIVGKLRMVSFLIWIKHG